ncbi:MAG TPA: DsbA family oxidoreductase [Vicinamibacterales bacterium]|nr:DsbA family oxidoreductase [Vicinamibacterales bacterium]
MRIDVWSDLVCPWCYIGKRRLEHALAEFPDRERVEIVHRSFQLNPSAPMGTTARRRDYLMAKYGWSTAQAEKIDADMERRAAVDGLEYHLSPEGLTGNTLDAHRLVHLARERGRQDAAVERFFRAYFTEQRSLFDHASLAPLAVDVGLDPDEVRHVLEGHGYSAAVADDSDEARALGVTGVPFFVFDMALGVSGAQPTELFTRALDQAWNAVPE